ncbi:hypothetical protein [Burkholderia gladioli]|uniref:hypothetical protein n=1 Tax=Burkholderia gladioli TaxID=28095 RepID=UPI00163FDFD5|nr:hypothetical protein [Burkholderia gladioli]
MKNAIKVSPVWTKDLVARRAIEFMQFRDEVRRAHWNYRDACSRHRTKAKVSGHIDKEDPKFHRATRKEYLALHEAKTALYNAQRRLETAVRNCGDLKG